MPRQDEIATVLQGVRSALAVHDCEALAPLLADAVCFESCVGRAQVIEFLNRLSGGANLELVDVEPHRDRLIVTLELNSSGPAEAPAGRHRRVAVAFISGAQIVELQITADRDDALAAIQSELPLRPRTPTRMNALAAVFPVRDLYAALEHYDRLGFSVRAYERGGYGYANRDGVSLHLSVVSDLNSATTTSAVYLYVDDADLLYAEWRSAGVSGQFFEPGDTEYGLREGAHIDRDGNLMRFGSPCGTRAQRQPAE